MRRLEREMQCSCHPAVEFRTGNSPTRSRDRNFWTCDLSCSHGHRTASYRLIISLGTSWNHGFFVLVFLVDLSDGTWATCIGKAAWLSVKNMMVPFDSQANTVFWCCFCAVLVIVTIPLLALTCYNIQFFWKARGRRRWWGR